jgi:hypothetical protein
MRRDTTKIYQIIEDHAIRIATTVGIIVWLAGKIWDDLHRLFISLSGP